MERIRDSTDERKTKIAGRMSTIRRRSSILFQKARSSKNTAADTSPGTRSKEQDKNAFLSNRMKRFSSELESWNRERKLIKVKCKDLEKQQSLSAAGVEFDSSILSEEEQSFIKSAPNYQKIIENCEKVRKTTNKMILLLQKSEEHKKKLVDFLEKNVESTTKRLIQLSD